MSNGFWIYWLPGGLMVCLRWVWLSIGFSRHGGFCIEIEKPPTACHENYYAFPEQLAYIEFLPHRIRGINWQIPNTPADWKWEIIWAWDELMGN
jgi:hypothetical protein